MNDTTTLHLSSSSEGMARQRLAYRANFFGIAVVSAGACLVFLNTCWINGVLLVFLGLVVTWF